MMRRYIFSTYFHLLRYWLRSVHVLFTRSFEKLHLRGKKIGFLFIYSRDRNSGNLVVVFPTIRDFFLVSF